MRIRTISIIAAAMAIFIAVGCKKESEVVTLGASIANDNNIAKVHLSADNQPLWDSNDPVWVNGDDTRVISDVSTTNGTYAKIKGVTSSTSYLAIYPAEMATGNASNASIIIPASQTYDANKIKFPMVAYSDNSNKHLFFYNLCSLLKVSVTNNITNGPTLSLKKISVRSSDNLLCGTMALTVSSSTVTAGTPTNGGKEVELDLGSGMSVAPSATSQDFYIVIAPFATENDITITVTTTDNKIFSRTRTISSLAINTIASARLNVTTAAQLDPIGATTVGTLKVISAPGNLQYKNHTWDFGVFRFAAHQYDFIGSSSVTGTVSGSNNYIYAKETYSKHTFATNNAGTGDKWIDLFGWGTSGVGNFSGGQANNSINGHYVRLGCYANTNSSNYGPNYSSSNDASIANTVYDWGVNGSSHLGTGWRTLTPDEWNILMNTRNASPLNGTENARFACVTLHIDNKDIKGTFIFPDQLHWPVNVPYPNSINQEDVNFNSSHPYTAAEWALLEEEGVWFLPAAGYRNGTNTFTNIQTTGYYWTTTGGFSSSSGGPSGNAKYINVTTGTAAWHEKRYGCSVRLVKNVQ
jgi:hypothetical protein